MSLPCHHFANRDIGELLDATKYSDDLDLDEGLHEEYELDGFVVSDSDPIEYEEGVVPPADPDGEPDQNQDEDDDEEDSDEEVSRGAENETGEDGEGTTTGAMEVDEEENGTISADGQVRAPWPLILVNENINGDLIRTIQTPSLLPNTAYNPKVQLIWIL